MGQVEESKGKGKGKGKERGEGEGREAGGEMGDFDAKKLKKGYTVVIPEPRRYGVKEGKQGYVKCAWGDLRVSLIPFPIPHFFLVVMKISLLLS